MLPEHPITVTFSSTVGVNLINAVHEYMAKRSEWEYEATFETDADGVYYITLVCYPNMEEQK